MSNVVQLRAVQSRFEDGWAAFPETGRKRSSKKLSGPAWAKVAKEVGEDELLAAVHTREKTWGRWAPRGLCGNADLRHIGRAGRRLRANSPP